MQCARLPKWTALAAVVVRRNMNKGYPHGPFERERTIGWKHVSEGDVNATMLLVKANAQGAAMRIHYSDLYFRTASGTGETHVKGVIH